MFQSTVTTKGQTTIPKEVREAMNLKPGDRLLYTLDAENGVHIEVLQGAASLKGSLTSDKGKGMTFSQIRKAAAAKTRR